jgi:hypothetical protein
MVRFGREYQVLFSPRSSILHGLVFDVFTIATESPHEVVNMLQKYKLRRRLNVLKMYKLISIKIQPCPTTQPIEDWVDRSTLLTVNYGRLIFPSAIGVHNPSSTCGWLKRAIGNLEKRHAQLHSKLFGTPQSTLLGRLENGSQNR